MGSPERLPSREGSKAPRVPWVTSVPLALGGAGA